MKLLALAVLTFSLWAFSTYVWPTKWRYDTVAMRDKSVLVRTDRFNGQSFYLTSYGWVTAKPSAY